MRKTHRYLNKLICLWVLALMAFSGSAHAQSLPDGVGKETVETACSQCHGLKQATSARLTPEDWKAVVNDMLAQGAVLMEDEIPGVIDYLAKNFPRSTTDGKINVNRTAAKELVDSLHLTADEADALVKYREQNGYFNSWEDLGKVAGLNLKKLEPMKDKLAY